MHSYWLLSTGVSRLNYIKMQAVAGRDVSAATIASQGQITLEAWLVEMVTRLESLYLDWIIIRMLVVAGCLFVWDCLSAIFLWQS